MSLKNSQNLYIFSLITLVIVFCIPFSVKAFSKGEIRDFYIDSSYDADEREKTQGILKKISDKLYFYVDSPWWGGLSDSEQNEMLQQFDFLSNEFSKTIYPILTSNFGTEWNPGIDNDSKITILVHPMGNGRGGYFNPGNEYSRFIVLASNEREMIYLNSDYIDSSLAKSFLAHEFVHLITFNQKDRIEEVEEEVWLNEARAEYAPTLSGYDISFNGSNLQKRMGQFLVNPSNSLTDWQGKSSDYGPLNLFIQYLVDHYGVKILKDSLQSSKVGIPSINYALDKNGFDEDFAQIFTDWTIAVLVNDCSLGDKYCYKNPNLKNMRVLPLSNFLPVNSLSNLSAIYSTKKWSGNWHKIFGGGDTLTFKFEGMLKGDFKVPYVTCKKSGGCSVNFIDLDENQDGDIVLNNFNTEYSYLVVIPSVQNMSKVSNLTFSWKVISTMEENGLDPISELLALITSLQKQIAEVRAQIDSILAEGAISSDISCQKIDNDLYFGIRGDSQVRCLQEFLKNQGSNIYSEGLVTGNFLSLTQSAVIRFQEKYAAEVLTSLGLIKGTGYVGIMTRTKINQLFNL